MGDGKYNSIERVGPEVDNTIFVNPILKNSLEDFNFNFPDL